MERLLHDIPEIETKSSAYKQGSQLMYYKELDVSHVISHDDTLNHHSMTDSEDEHTDQSEIDLSASFGLNVESMCSRIYHVGRAVNNDISNIKEKMSWPPKLEELHLSECMRFIPTSLYNLIAIVTGVTDEVPDPESALNIRDESNHRRVLSLCQDIVSLGTKGRVLTPKSLACGMTLRHYSANKPTSCLVSGLGNSVGYHTLLRLETAAALQTQAEDIPSGFSSGKWTTLVWDNIDFSEETLTGADTTHFVNGIMLQKALSDTSDRVQSANISRTVKKMPQQDKGIVAISHSARDRIGPPVLEKRAGDEHHRLICPTLIDLAYLMIKEVHHNPRKLPSWKHFNQGMWTSSENEKTAIHYMPLIEAPATDINTINTILVRSIAIADQLNLKKIVLVFDQAIYAKIQELRWKHHIYAERTIVRMGEFHTIMSYLSILGKRFNSGGLGDIMVESGVVAAGSLPSVLSGKHYNRAARAHKLVYEALSRLRIRQFLGELDEVNANAILEEADRMSTSHMKPEFLDQNMEQLTKFSELYDQHVASQCGSNPTYKYWSSYLDMVQLLLIFIRATRVSDWDLHLATIQEMLPWFFAYNRTNYCRYEEQNLLFSNHHFYSSYR